MSKIVAHLKDNKGRKYKIEYVVGPTLSFKNYWYNVLYENNDVKYREFNSKEAAIRYLEEAVGPCREY